MQQVFEKMKLGDRSYKTFFAVMIVAFGGAIIYGLPYFRYDFYDVYLETYHLTNTQMGVFGTVLGVFGMVSYLFGGVVADKFTTRTILTTSLIGTGIGGLIHLLPLNYHALIALYAFWGISSLFAFWPACIKAVRMLTGSGEQGKAFGFFEGGRGVAAAFMTMFAVVAFRIGAGQLEDQQRGMRYVIIFYSLLTIALGVMTYFTVHQEERIKSEEISFTGIREVLKMPAVWIISFVTFSNYVFTQSLYYFTPYSTNFFAASVTFAAGLASARRWFSLLGSVGGGVATDKFGTGKMLLVSFLIMIGGCVGILALPLREDSLFLFTVLFIIIFIFYNVNYAMTWAMLDEGAIPMNYSGTAAGVISTIGYLPEIFCSVFAGFLIDQYPGVTGYRYYFFFLIGMLAFGVFLVLVWMRYLRALTKKKGETQSEEIHR